MCTNFPFALFVLSDLGSEKINEILKDAGNPPHFWLASNDYNDAPTKERKDGKANVGTEPTIGESWKSPFIGYKIEEVAAWLKKKPDSVDLDGNHFAVLDEESTDGSVLACKIGDIHLRGNWLDTYRLESGQRADDFLNGLEFGEWEENKGTDNEDEYPHGGGTIYVQV